MRCPIKAAAKRERKNARARERYAEDEEYRARAIRKSREHYWGSEEARERAKERAKESNQRAWADPARRRRSGKRRSRLPCGGA